MILSTYFRFANGILVVYFWIFRKNKRIDNLSTYFTSDMRLKIFARCSMFTPTIKEIKKKFLIYIIPTFRVSEFHWYKHSFLQVDIFLDWVTIKRVIE